MSYSLYLWHFPVLVIGTTYLEPAGWLVRSCLVGVAVVAAWLSYRYVEDPLSSHPVLASSAWVSLATGAALILTTSGTAMAASALSGSSTRVLNAQGQRVDLGDDLIDPLAGARSTSVPGCTAVAFEATTNDRCLFGDPQGDKTAVLLGDSHAASLGMGLLPAAEDAGWQVTMWTKPACPIPSVTYYDGSRRTANAPCDTWRDATLAKTIEMRPDVVVPISAMSDAKQVMDPESGERLSAEESRPHIVEGYRTTIERLTAEGIPVVVVQDWPSSPEGVPDCLLQTRDARRCSFGRPSVPRPEPQAVRGLDGVRLLTVDDGFCGESRCSPVPDDILVYRDTNHFTRSYALTLGPLLTREILDRY